MRILTNIPIALLLVSSFSLRGAEPAPDLFLGKWALDAKASKYPGNTCPRQMTIEMTREPRGVHYRSETSPATGAPFHVDYVADYDGKPAIVTGDRGILLPVALRREAANHIKATYRNAFEVMATSDRTLSDDGKTMTIVTVSRDSLGQSQTSVGVYHRVEAVTSVEHGPH